jgi:nitrogenase molybdenum-iron protein alpha/beta subunit
MPMNKKGKKFLTNHRTAILGYHVVEGMNLDFMFNEKSMKDVMVLFEMGYYSVAPIGENTKNPEVLDTIDGLANTIVNFYDFDYAGIKASNYLRKKYGWGYVFLTNGRFGTIDYKAKDISDFVKINDVEAGKNIIQHLLS